MLFTKPSHHLFIPTAAGPSQCYACAERDAATCRANLFTQTCATDQSSLGTTHCGSAVGKYQDKSGKVLDGFIRGCIQCTGKEMQFLQRSCEMLEQLKLIFFFNFVVCNLCQSFLSIKHHCSFEVYYFLFHVFFPSKVTVYFWLPFNFKVVLHVAMSSTEHTTKNLV